MDVKEAQRLHEKALRECAAPSVASPEFAIWDALRAAHSAIATLQRERDGLATLAEQLYQAAWFAEPFVRHCAEVAPEPRLAKECLSDIGKALTTYRATTGTHAHD